jgi:hypothetical protein
MTYVLVAFGFTSGIASGFFIGAAVGWFVWLDAAPGEAEEPPALDLDIPENRARLEAWLRGLEARDGRR